MGTYNVILRTVGRDGKMKSKDSRLGFSTEQDANRFGKGMVRDYQETVKGYSVTFDPTN